MNTSTESSAKLFLSVGADKQFWTIRYNF